MSCEHGAGISSLSVECICAEDVLNAVGCICGSGMRADYLRHLSTLPGQRTDGGA